MSWQVVSLKADEAVNWFQKRLKNAVNYGLSTEDCKMFEIFITSTLNDVDIKKQIINTVIPTFFENILTRKVNKPTVDAQVSIIRLFMKYYGGTCSQFKNVLDKFTSKTLRECFNEDNIVFKVTKYLALYPQCGGRGQQGVNHAETWTNQFNDYLYSANYFLNQLYSTVNFFMGTKETDTYKGKFDISIFNLSELGQITPKEYYEKLTSVFIFFNTAIQSMLLSMFSTTKRFNSNKVVEFALSTLSVTSEKLNATVITENMIALDSVLWKLHCSAIKTVSALIKCCGRILIPQGVLICRLLLQSLNITHFSSSNSVYGTTRSKLQQRVLTYQVLCSWQTVTGSQSSLEMFSESLTSSILIDIKYNKPSLNLIVDKQVGNKKRKSGALNEKIINQRDTIVMHDYHANKSICKEAHLTLQLFLNTMSSNLKPLQFKTFQSTIMGLLLEVIKCQRANDYPLPYYDDLCRLNLYKSLLATVISPHPQCITHTSVAVRIFTLGTTDRSESIKEVCRSSLSKLEHIIRPRNDTLFFPLENVEEMPQSTQNAMPENKTHFLSEIISDDMGINDKTKRLPVFNTNDIESTVISFKTSPINVVKCNENNKLVVKCSNTSPTINLKQTNSPTETKPQEIIISNDQKSVTENSQKQVDPLVISEISDKLSAKTPINVNLPQDNKQVMEVESNVDSNTINESSDEEDEIEEDQEDENIEEMLKDFLDSD